MADYLKRYRDRLGARGETKFEQVQNIKIDNFENYMEVAPNVFPIIINGITYEVIIEGISYGERNKYDGVLLARLNTPITVGTSFHYDENDYIVVRLEEDSVPSNIAAKIKVCNNVLTWKENNGSTGLTVNVPCIIGDKSIGELDEDKYFPIPTDKTFVTIPNNITTNSLQEGKRFIFNHSSVYKITHIDELTKVGLIELTIEKTQKVPNDDLVNNIAYDENLIVVNNAIPNPLTYDIIITGETSIKINRQQTYTAKAYDKGVLMTGKTFTWNVIDTDGTSTTLATIVGGETSCQVNAGSKTGKVKLYCRLIGYSGVEKTITLDLISIF